MCPQSYQFTLFCLFVEASCEQNPVPKMMDAGSPFTVSHDLLDEHWSPAPDIQAQSSSMLVFLYSLYLLIGSEVKH